jgi:hypothetical protein
MNTFFIILYFNIIKKKKKKKKKTIIFIIYRRMHVESKGKQINYIYYRLSQLIIESLQ